MIRALTSSLLLVTAALCASHAKADERPALSPCTPSAPSFVASDWTYTLGPQTLPNGDVSDVEVYYASGTSRIQPMSTGWQLLRANPSPFTTPVLGDDAAMLNVYVKTCDSGQWVDISTTPFALFSPTQQISAGTYTYSGYFNGSLPGTRVTPTYECGGNDITIPTFIGPQTLRTNASVTFAYVLEHHKKH